MSASEEHDTGPLEKVTAFARHEKHRYAHGEDRPLGSYLVTSAVYLAGTAASVAALRAGGRTLPARFDARDLALLAVATHKAARLLTKDPVTSPLRAPVTRFEGPGGPAEVHEEVRGKGARHAVGELVTCPFCMGQWIATAGVLGLVAAPRLTRFVASTLAVVAGSDFLQLAYAAAQQHSS